MHFVSKAMLGQLHIVSYCQLTLPTLCFEQAVENEEYGAANRKSQQFLASVKGQKRQAASHAADGFYSSQPAAKPKPVKRRPPPPVTQTKSFKPQGGSDEVLRGKVSGIILFNSRIHFCFVGMTCICASCE